MAVYVIQKIGEGHNPTTNPQYVPKVGKKTAGGIAKDLVKAANGISDATLRSQVAPPAARFEVLVERRNGLIHSNPATVGTEQRLVRKGFPWTIPELENVADDFTECSGQLNDLDHNTL